MKTWSIRNFVAVGMIALFGLSQAATADVGVRGGLVKPQGDIKSLAKSGWRAEVTADLNFFRMPFLSTVVSVGAMDFGKKKTEYTSGEQTYTQESHIALTGGGIGLRVAPPTLAIKPYAEALIRLASIEQEFKDGADFSSLESKTKFGYQVNAGVKFPMMPKVAFEVGGSYVSFAKNNYFDRTSGTLQERELELKAYSIYAGISLGLGL